MYIVAHHKKRREKMKLKPGDKVIMTGPCIEAITLKYGNGRVWTVRSESWKLGHGTEVIKLEGMGGGYRVDCLEKIN